MERLPTSADIIDRLALAPHPEGGWYRETWRDESGSRGAGSAIYFLLRAGDVSHWHHVDAVELWHHYLGAPISHSTATDGGLVTTVLGSDLAAGEEPQLVVPAHVAIGAESRRLDARRLHNGAHVHLRRLRSRAARLGTGLIT